MENKAAKARAIDHEFNRMITTAFKRRRRDEAAPIAIDADDVIQHMGDPDGLAVLPQISGKQSCIDVIGIGKQPVETLRTGFSG